MKIEERLSELNIVLLEPPLPVASYLPGIFKNNLIFVSGQLPTRDGKLLATGKLGRDLDIKTGQMAARQAAINCLAVLKALLGNLDRVEQIIKITGYVQSVDDFFEQPQVVNGASNLLQEVFGLRGQHARTAVGVAALPFNAPCEIELIACIKNER